MLVRFLAFLYNMLERTVKTTHETSEIAVHAAVAQLDVGHAFPVMF